MNSQLHFQVNGSGRKTAVVVPIEEYRRRAAGDGADRWRDFTPLEAALIGAGLAQSDPQRISGAVCFVVSPRFQVSILFDNIDAGLPMDEFCSEVYPGQVPREVLEQALEVRRRLLGMGPVPAARRRRRRPSRAELDESYRAMAADTAGEAEALEWCEAMIGDVADDPDDHPPHEAR